MSDSEHRRSGGIQLPAAESLIGAPAREMYADLSGMLRESRAILADIDALDARITATVTAAPKLDGPSGSVLLPAMTGPGVTLLADLDRRTRLTASDPDLVGWARAFVTSVAPLMDRLKRARFGLALRLRSRQTRNAINAALLAGYSWHRRALEAGLPQRLTAAAAARGAVADSPEEAITQPTDAHIAALQTITGMVADDAARPLLDAAAVRDLAGVGRLAKGLVDQDRAGRRRVQRSFDDIRQGGVERALQEVPLGRLRETSSVVGLRLAAIEESGCRTVADVLRVGPDALDRVPGVGRVTAQQVYAAARQLADVVGADLQPRLDPESRDPATTALVRALRDWARVGAPQRWLRGDLERADEQLGEWADLRLPSTGQLMPVRAADASPVGVGARLEEWARWWGARHTEVVRAREEIGRAHTARPSQPISPDQDGDLAWSDFLARPAEYYAWLGEITGFGAQPGVERGELPEEIVASIRAFKLDLSLVTASVRGYQEFGARFALVQERTILGDEMGLGKTVQAIAAMAHLAAAGERHALVVCPASVLVNWQRELARHSRLTAYRLHGDDRAAAVAEWIRDGGVGVTTYGQLYALDIPAKLPISLLVADEAHYLKNPLSQRSLAFQRYLSRCPRVLLMSGTPLENRLDEFATLVGYLQPQLLAQIDPAAALVKAAAFREAVAPVYLRRNHEDVLTELPDLVETDEWIDLSRADREVYAAAVRSGNFMAMRQAAWRGAPGQPAKLERLLEIVEESTDNGHRVIVFSFFRSVLERIAAALTSELPRVPVFGPLTGSLTAEARQRLVDDFGRSERPGVLVSQIEAGGVGLNIQSASVVVLTEPQIKPSWESQAIARVHRMGQVRTVQVHRLLADDSVDERMQEILREKEAVFAAYVRDSAVSEAAPEAIDVSERNLAARIIAEEQRRLGLGPSDTMAQPQDSASAPQDSATAPQDSATAPQDSRPGRRRTSGLEK